MTRKIIMNRSLNTKKVSLIKYRNKSNKLCKQIPKYLWENQLK